MKTSIVFGILFALWLGYMLFFLPPISLEPEVKQVPEWARVGYSSGPFDYWEWDQFSPIYNWWK